MIKKHKDQTIYKAGSLIFAPMEGIADKFYRQAVMEVFPEWDFYFTEFLRVPNDGRFTKNFLINHVGSKIVNDETLKSKTVFQIMPTEDSNNVHMVEKINELGFSWVDINFCCPSKTVNNHKGGAFLLQYVDKIKKIINEIRKKYVNTLSVKIRIGYHNDENFFDIIKAIEDEGVDLITIHPRTKDQQYTGRANWSYIEKAVETVQIPIVGNGDVRSSNDVEKMFSKTKCSSVMIGRRALGAPWLARLYKNNLNEKVFNFKDDFLAFIQAFEEETRVRTLDKSKNSDFALRRLKHISNYTLLKSDKRLTGGDDLQKRLLKAKSLEEFKEHVFQAELSCFI